MEQADIVNATVVWYYYYTPYFGKRDHTTVTHAIHCVDRLRVDDERIGAAARVLMASWKPRKRCKRIRRRQR